MPRPARRAPRLERLDMPITYDVDLELGLLHIRCSGNVTLAEVVSHFRELESASLPPRMDVLLDLSDVRSDPRTDQLRSAAREVELLKPKMEWGSCAIVAERDLVFGIARIFHTFVREHFVDANVLRDVEEARAWLASLRSSSRPG